VTETTILASEPETPDKFGIRISDAAARAGVSPRTMRYYEELGLLSPTLFTQGGERRYTTGDLEQLGRILELREVLGMNLEEIKEFLSFENRLEELRSTYRAVKGSTSERARSKQEATLREAIALNESLAEQLRAKVARMEEFRAKLAGDAKRWRDVLAELE
jgi:MerR family transcriptional regulator, repressor of the yfmOP operon